MSPKSPKVEKRANAEAIVSPIKTGTERAWAFRNRRVWHSPKPVALAANAIAKPTPLEANGKGGYSSSNVVYRSLVFVLVITADQHVVPECQCVAQHGLHKVQDRDFEDPRSRDRRVRHHLRERGRVLRSAGHVQLLQLRGHHHPHPGRHHSHHLPARNRQALRLHQLPHVRVHQRRGVLYLLHHRGHSHVHHHRRMQDGTGGAHLRSAVRRVRYHRGGPSGAGRVPDVPRQPVRPQVRTRLTTDCIDSDCNHCQTLVIYIYI